MIVGFRENLDRGIPGAGRLVGWMYGYDTIIL